MADPNTPEARQAALDELTHISEVRQNLRPRPKARSSSGGMMALVLLLVLLLGAGITVGMILILQGPNGGKPIAQQEPANAPPAAARQPFKPPVVTRLTQPPTVANESVKRGTARIDSMQAGFVRLDRAGPGVSSRAPRGIFDMGDETSSAPSEVVLAVVLTITCDGGTPVTYRSFNYSTAKAALKDGNGATVTCQALSQFEPVIHAPVTTVIQGGKKVTDTLIFSPSKSGHFELILPGENLGLSGPLTVPLPADLGG